jgi:asparagine synthetase B (glutamine-hydrolysing)
MWDWGTLASLLLTCRGGAQPTWDTHEKSVFVFNGEIYNYVKLKRELEA